MNMDPQKMTLLVDLAYVQTSNNVRQSEHQKKGRCRCTLRKVLMLAGAFIMAGFIQASAFGASDNPTNAAPSTPTLSARMLPSGFHLQVSGGTGSYTLQSSADPGFRDPQYVTNFEAGTNAFRFVDPRPIQGAALYYRIVPNGSGSATNHPSVTNKAPVIVFQPGSTNVVVGGAATFRVTASGRPRLHYQWYGPTNALIPGATASTLTLSNVQPSDAGNYFVTVSNHFGTAASSNAVLTVTGGTNSGTAPVITQQPTNQTVIVGGTATFSVTATGSPVLSYLWFQSPATLVSSSTNPTLTLSNVQPSNAGSYFVIVSNLFGSATSSDAVLTVTNQSSGAAPVITQQPSNQTVTVGGTASFSATATGTAPLHYQWYGPASALIPGATASTLTLSNVQPSAAGAYFVFVTNQFGFAQSSNAVLTITGTNSGTAPVIIFQPDNTNVVTGGSVAFRVMATGTAPLHYQWYGPASALIPGATASTLTLSNVQPSAAGAYFVFVTNQFGFAQSSNAVLTVTGGTNSGTAPVITQQPTNQTVTVGGTATFSVTATGSPVLSYLWFQSPATLVSSSTSPTLTLSNVQPSNAGSYFVIVSNLFGSAASSNAVLTVTNQSSGTVPVITQQPSNQTVSVGGAAGFSVTATGAPSLHYQWFGPATNPIAGAINPVLILSNVQPSQAGPYFVLVTNAFGFAISSNAILTVTGNSSNLPPVITQQPTNQTVIVGGTASFSATATGTAPLHYQWYGPASALIPGATASTLILSNVQPSAAGDYFVFVTNQFGFAQSSNAVLTVTNQSSGTAPVITQQPSNQTVTVGGTAGFSVTATGAPALHYQWFGPATNPIAGAINPVLVLSNVQPSQAGPYFVLVTNAFGFAISSNAILTVTGNSSNLPPVITQQPSNRTVTVGGTATFSVTAIGSPVLSYLWFQSPATLVSSSTSPTLTLSDVQPSNAGSYFVIVSNLFGTATSSNVVLTVTNQSSGTAPVITQQPSNQTVAVGGTASFSATTTGTAPLHYQWYGPASALIPGATASTLTLSNVQPSAAGAYFVFVTNQFGFAQSSNAVLTVDAGTNQAPVVIFQPDSTNVVVGGAATFRVTATGTVPLSYRWFKDEQNNPISNATNANYVISLVNSNDVGSYFVQVANPAGSVLSSNAVLTITGP
jgi:Ig-like domain-containing protein